MIVQEQIIEEIRQIPSDKLEELYDLIHAFRVNIEHGQVANNASFAERWRGRFTLSDATGPRLDYLKRRYQL